MHKGRNTIEPGSVGPLPLIIGVTGHRDLPPDGAQLLEGIVRATFVDLQNAHPHCPLVLLSPLAEGADRLVARVALDMRLRVIVPLPLPLDVYEQDFETAESLADFRRLMGQAEGRIALPLVGDSTVESIRTRGPHRDRQYAAVGAYIAKHSQIVLALWDGVRPADGEKPGGTAQVVQFRLEGAPEPFDPPRGPLTFVNNGPVYHIFTPRLQNPTSGGQAYTRRNLVPAHRAAESFDAIYRRMDTFNADVLSSEGRAAEAIGARLEPLGGAGSEGGTSEATPIPGAARTILDHYAIADALAVHFSRKTHRASARLFQLVFVAALCFNVYHSFPHADTGVPWLLVLFVLLFLGSSALHRRAVTRDYQNKYQDYRAIAEALRIQFFWRAAGVRESVVDHYLRKQRGDLEWIRSALRSWDVLAEAAAGGSPEIGPEPVRHLHYVRQHWVAEQRTYFASKARHEVHTLERDERLVAALVGASLAATLAFATVLILPMFVHLPVFEALEQLAETLWIHGTVLLTIAMLLVLAGLRHGYSQLLARSEHAKQYSRMSVLFEIADRRLEALLREHRDEEAQGLVQALGEEALEENGDWVLLHRERPLEVPHAG